MPSAAKRCWRRSSRSRDGCTATLRRRRRSRALTRHRATLAGCVFPTSSRRWARTADKKTADLHLLAGRLLHAVCHNQGAARSEQRCAAFDRGTLPQPRRLREPDPHRGLRPDRIRVPAARGRRDHHPGSGRASRVAPSWLIRRRAEGGSEHSIGRAWYECLRGAILRWVQARAGAACHGFILASTRARESLARSVSNRA